MITAINKSVIADVVLARQFNDGEKWAVSNARYENSKFILDPFQIKGIFGI